MSEEEIKGLVILIQEYKEALRTTLPLANEVKRKAKRRYI